MSAAQPEDGSDVDELVDSESERAEMDAALKTRASSGRTGSGRGRSRGGASSRNTRTQQQSQSQSHTKQDAHPSPKNNPSPPPSTTMDRGSENGVAAAPTTDSTQQAAAAATSSSSSSSKAMETAKEQKSPRELLGRTATGGPVPYYYPQPSAVVAATKPSQSPQDSPHKKVKSDSGSLNNSDDLTLPEVDKFLDLIEKHNLHTSNEADMARSVTELYQEWLEWCAKRNVQSTKSKQALVAEFVRIHQGNYGSTRQKRAMEIVQGSGGSNAGGGNIVLEGDGSHVIGREREREPEGVRQIAPPSSLPPPKAAANTRLLPKHHKEEDLRGEVVSGRRVVKALGWCECDN